MGGADQQDVVGQASFLEGLPMPPDILDPLAHENSRMPVGLLGVVAQGRSLHPTVLVNGVLSHSGNGVVAVFAGKGAVSKPHRVGQGVLANDPIRGRIGGRQAQPELFNGAVLEAATTEVLQRCCVIPESLPQPLVMFRVEALQPGRLLGALRLR